MNSHLLWSPFGWSAIRNFSEGPGFSIGPFQKVQREVIYFPYVVMKCRRKLSKNCSINDKNREFSGPYNFWTPVKRDIPDVWNWNCWALFGSETEVGALAPLSPLPHSCHAPGNNSNITKKGVFELTFSGTLSNKNILVRLTYRNLSDYLIILIINFLTFSLKLCPTKFYLDK